MKTSKKKKKLDTLASKACRIRDNYTCRRCGKYHKQTHAAHIFTRSHLGTRWDLENLLTLCYFCHIQWSHRQPVEFTLWVQELIGMKKFEELRKKSQEIKGSYLSQSRYESHEKALNKAIESQKVKKGTDVPVVPKPPL